MRKQKNNFVYSIKISKEDKELLKNSDDIKKDLDKYVREYLASFRGAFEE